MAYEIKPGLERVNALCDAITNKYGLSKKIQDISPAIHIAGTNGKGSVGTMLSAIYEKMGYKVGHFSSPAVFEYEEMFRINGKNADKRELKAVFSEIEKIAENETDKPSAFEKETAAAFLYFYKNKCDLNIIECGMGGLLDATNVINNKLASVITSIGMDHMSFLGDSIEKIAKIKAGITVPGGVCVIGAGCDEAEDVLTREAMLNNNNVAYAADLLRHSEKFAFMPDGRIVQKFKYKFYDISLPLAGTYQLDNAITALETIDAVGERYPEYSVDIKKAEEALLNVEMPGRLECIHQNPPVYIDGAHNENAWIMLSKSIENYFTNKHLIFIIGVLADKEYDKMLKLMADKADYIFAVTPPSERALLAENLKKEAEKYTDKVTASESIDKAVKMAEEKAKPDGVIIAFGSLSYLSEIKKYFEEK
ncbi:MAG: bifunctional folylpolyglutamate synthase/dihydrofolate synthase [Eubacterium sp.]|nr:bifunctional folylpolyglutamate synthase/dihydrofolate synthase [Eubacterium sp.]